MRDLPPLFILRHGETVWNAEGRFQGHLDAPLTELGRAQAAVQGQILRDHVLPHHPQCAVWVSPLGRAQATWRIAAEAAGVPVARAHAEPRLSEVHMGAWQGRLRTACVVPKAPAAPTNLFEMSLTTPGGETFDALKTRLEALLADLTGPTICITHGITSLVLRGILRGQTRAQMAGQGHDQGIVYAVIHGQEHRLEATARD